MFGIVKKCVDLIKGTEPQKPQSELLVIPRPSLDLSVIKRDLSQFHECLLKEEERQEGKIARNNLTGSRHYGASATNETVTLHNAARVVCDIVSAIHETGVDEIALQKIDVHGWSKTLNRARKLLETPISSVDQEVVDRCMHHLSELGLLEKSGHVTLLKPERNLAGRS